MPKDPEHDVTVIEALTVSIRDILKRTPDISFICGDGKTIHSHRYSAILTS